MYEEGCFAILLSAKGLAIHQQLAPTLFFHGNWSAADEGRVDLVGLAGAVEITNGYKHGYKAP